MKESKQRKIFDEWVSDYRALLFKVIRSYATHQEDQDDLFQEVCFQIYRSIPNFKGNAAVTTWLYRIALNTAIKWSTKERKRAVDHQDISTSHHLITMKEEAKDDRVAWLYHEIHQFNEIDKSLTLLLLEGYSYKEMAEMIGISESNIGVKLHRIKKQLVENAKSYDYGT